MFIAVYYTKNRNSKIYENNNYERNERKKSLHNKSFYAFADHKCSEKIRIIKCQAYWYATHHAETHMQTFIPLFLTFLQFSRNSKLFTPPHPVCKEGQGVVGARTPTPLPHPENARRPPACNPQTPLVGQALYRTSRAQPPEKKARGTRMPVVRLANECLQ